VTSRPREELTFTEVQHAFKAGRLCLPDYQMVALYRLVEMYLSNPRPNLRASVVEHAKDMFEITDENIRSFKNQKMSARQLSSYLVYLRIVASRPADDREVRGLLPWEVWAGKKAALKIRERAHKPVEFDKALAGKEYCLTKEEVEANVKSLELIPVELLLDIVKLKVECWVFDTDSRRDYSHKMSMAIERWQKDNKTNLRKKSVEYVSPIKRQIKDKLIADKSKSLVEAEHKEAVISLELFWKFERQSRETGWKATVCWKEWLDKNLEIDRQHLVMFKDANVKRNQASAKENREG
jgi:hypothetical protein